VGFFQDWVDRRRRRELEKINREIEDLKKKGPDYVPSQEKDRSGSSPGVRVSASKPTGVIIVLILLLIGLLVFHFFRIGSLKADFSVQEEDMLQLQEDLTRALEEINLTQSALEIKERVESNLTTKYVDLKDDVVDLKIALSEVNNSLQNKEDEIADKTQELNDLDDYVDELKDCIKNDSITDKEDCL
jgi:hypothetical protein